MADNWAGRGVPGGRPCGLPLSKDPDRGTIKDPDQGTFTISKEAPPTTRRAARVRDSNPRPTSQQPRNQYDQTPRPSRARTLLITPPAALSKLSVGYGSVGQAPRCDSKCKMHHRVRRSPCEAPRSKPIVAFAK